MYDVQVETRVNDGKKAVALQNFDYDPIARSYTLAIKSLQARTVTDTLRIDVLGPAGVVIHHEEAQVVLAAGQVLHYTVEVPAELGQPQGLRVTLDDPFEGIIETLAAAGSALYNAAKQYGTATFTVKFYADVLGLTIVEYQYNAPGPSKGFRWFPYTSASDVLWALSKWMSKTAWDVKKGRYALGQGGVEGRVNLGISLTVDQGKCPDPNAIPGIEQALRDLAVGLDANLSKLKVEGSLSTPSLPLFWIVLLWGKGTAKLAGNARASGLSLNLTAQGSLDLALQVGLGLPLADYATAISELANIYRWAASSHGLISVVL